MGVTQDSSSEHVKQIFGPSKKDSNLETLRALTEALSSFSHFVGFEGPTFIEMKMDKGVSFGWKLLWEDAVYVARWFSSSGSEFSVHSHPEPEWTIVYSGKMVMHYPHTGEEKTLEAGESTFHQSDTQHSAVFLKDTWYITVTIPAQSENPSMPDGEGTAADAIPIVESPS